MRMDFVQRMDRTEKALSLARSVGGKNGLNCIAELDPTAAAQAEEMKGKPYLPLSGEPVLVKDNIDVRGLRTTAGSLALADNIACRDARVIENLRRRGAVIIGKTNMTEFANYTTRGMPGGYSSRGGQVIHAADPELSPSGSSSGSAVAVSSGIVRMAVGTDTSFSITGCAQANGICGLKPPVGALSGEGIIPLAPTLDSAGALAGRFSDALRLYSAMRDEPLPDIRPTPPGKLRIAVNTAGRDQLAADQEGFLTLLLDRLRADGASLSEITQPYTAHIRTVMKWEFRPALEAYLERSAASLKTLSGIVGYYERHPETMMRYGDVYLREALDNTPGGLLGEPYLEAMRIRSETISRVTAEISDLDAVIMTGSTNIMHFCGLPSVTVAGKMKDGCGVNRTVIMYGKDECRLYRAALTVERELTEIGNDCPAT